MKNLTLDQINSLYENRKALIEKANNLPLSFYIVDNGLKHPARLAGCKLEYCVIYAGNLKAEISWKLVEKIANGEVTEIN